MKEDEVRIKDELIKKIKANGRRRNKGRTQEEQMWIAEMRKSEEKNGGNNKNSIRK